MPKRNRDLDDDDAMPGAAQQQQAIPSTATTTTNNMPNGMLSLGLRGGNHRQQTAVAQSLLHNRNNSASSRVSNSRSSRNTAEVPALVPGVISSGPPVGFAANLTILVFNPLVFYQVEGTTKTPGRGGKTPSSSSFGMAGGNGSRGDGWRRGSCSDGCQNGAGMTRFGQQRVKDSLRQQQQQHRHGHQFPSNHHGHFPSSSSCHQHNEHMCVEEEEGLALEVVHQQEQQFLADVAHSMNCRCRFQVVGSQELPLWRKLAASIEERFRLEAELRMEGQVQSSSHPKYAEQDEDEEDDSCPQQQQHSEGHRQQQGNTPHRQQYQQQHSNNFGARGVRCFGDEVDDYEGTNVVMSHQQQRQLREAQDEEQEEGFVLPMSIPQPTNHHSGMKPLHARSKKVHYAVLSQNGDSLVLPNSGDSICPGIATGNHRHRSSPGFQNNTAFGQVAPTAGGGGGGLEEMPPNRNHGGGGQKHSSSRGELRTPAEARKVAAELDHWVTEMYVRFLFNGG